MSEIFLRPEAADKASRVIIHGQLCDQEHEFLEAGKQRLVGDIRRS